MSKTFIHKVPGIPCKMSDANFRIISVILFFRSTFTIDSILRCINRTNVVTTQMSEQHSKHTALLAILKKFTKHFLSTLHLFGNKMNAKLVLNTNSMHTKSKPTDMINIPEFSLILSLKQIETVKTTENRKQKKKSAVKLQCQSASEA